jgi:hypothetical protein
LLSKKFCAAALEESAQLRTFRVLLCEKNQMIESMQSRLNSLKIVETVVENQKNRQQTLFKLQQQEKLSVKHVVRSFFKRVVFFFFFLKEESEQSAENTVGCVGRSKIVS